MLSSVIVDNITDFHPEHTFMCGQCFRWDRQSDGSFTGVAQNRVVNISLDQNKLIIKGSDKDDYENIWKRYLDLARDYAKIKSLLSSKDRFLLSAVKYGWGIHILKQDFFETLLSFIISSNNNIPRISGIINAISHAFGKKINFMGKEYYTFPSHDKLCGIEAGDLAPFKTGYRAPYLVDAINRFSSLCPEEIAVSPVNTARKILCEIKGVGPKVADCILLFSFGRFEVFPTDVWVKRVMAELYNCEAQNATAYGENLFGDLAGIAQQYLFYQRREGGEAV